MLAIVLRNVPLKSVPLNVSPPSIRCRSLLLLPMRCRKVVSWGRRILLYAKFPFETQLVPLPTTWWRAIEWCVTSVSVPGKRPLLF